MSVSCGGAAASLPYSNSVRLAGPDQPLKWVAAGWREFLAAPALSAAYGLVFAAIGLALALALWRTPFFYMLLPLASGFMLLGPVATTGFQAISREIEKGRQPSFAAALDALSVNSGPIFYAALAFLLLFLAWLRISELLFALAFPPEAASLDPQAFLKAAFFTAGGLEFLALFVPLGFVGAALAFAGGAFALPMLVDRQVGAFEAIAASFSAVALNLRTMAVWAGLLVALTVVGMMLLFVGLAVTLPVAGHAAWHAYRATIKP